MRAAAGATLAAIAATLIAGGATAHRGVSGASVRQFEVAGPEWVGAFAPYRNDGYELAVEEQTGGVFTLTVTASASPLESRAAFPLAAATVESFPGDAVAALERAGTTAGEERIAELSRSLTAGARRQHAAVEAVLLWVSAHVRYELSPGQDQSAGKVLARRSGNCVGFAELSAELLRSAGIPARTVAGIVAGQAPGGRVPYSRRLGGSLHRWVEVYYADSGWVFSDPLATLHFVDATYLPLQMEMAGASAPRRGIRQIWAHGDFVTVTRDSGRARDGKERLVRRSREAAPPLPNRRAGAPR